MKNWLKWGLIFSIVGVILIALNLWSMIGYIHLISSSTIITWIIKLLLQFGIGALIGIYLDKPSKINFNKKPNKFKLVIGGIILYFLIFIMASGGMSVLALMGVYSWISTLLFIPFLFIIFLFCRVCLHFMKEEMDWKDFLKPNLAKISVGLILGITTILSILGNIIPEFARVLNIKFLGYISMPFFILPFSLYLVLGSIWGYISYYLFNNVVSLLEGASDTTLFFAEIIFPLISLFLYYLASCELVNFIKRNEPEKNKKKK